MSPVVAVITAFRPDLGRLQKALESVARQVEWVIIVNNGSESDLQDLALPGNTKIRHMGYNRGVAAAFNEGVRAGCDHKAGAFFFMDQDSIPAPKTVSSLVAAWGESEREGLRVAACGPAYDSPGNRGKFGFVRIKGWGLERAVPGPGPESFPCDFLISSGMLIPAATLKIVGAMEEPLFIDHIDTEWCFRAKSRGFQCLGLGSGHMDHQLGERSRPIWLGRWRNIPVHAPFRYYFIARNTILLRKRPYMPIEWRRHELARLVGLLIANGLFSRQGCEIRNAFMKGFVDGIHGRVMSTMDAAKLIEKLR